MRTIVLLTLCIAVVCGIPVLAAPASPPAKVNLELKDTLLKAAIDAVFKAAGLDYVLDQSEDAEEFLSENKATLKLTDAAPEDAIRALLSIQGLTYRRENGVYRISVKPAPQRVMEMVQAGMKRMGDPRLVPVTAVVPQMPIREALRRIGVGAADYPDLSFAESVGDLDKILMPGARFYQFPKQMAEIVLLAACGLLPPDPSTRAVEKRGKADLPSVLIWEHQPCGKSAPEAAGSAEPQSSGDVRPSKDGAVAPAATGGNEFKISGKFSSEIDTNPAIAAYKSPQGGWLFTIFASRVQDTRLLEKLFSTSGCSYVMGDVSLRPQKVRQMVNGKLIESSTWTSYHQTVSAQLYDVTLDEALDVLLPTLALTYRKEGPPSGPTYVIDIAASRGSTSATPAADAKPPVKKPQRR